MSNELATLDLNQLPSTQLGSDEAYTELAKGGDFLKYVKLYTKGEAIDAGRISPGHWGVPETKEEITDLGDSIDILPLARRPKALDSSDSSAIIVSYDEQSEDFKRIVEQSTESNSNCQYGTSFLVLERFTGQFLELWLNSKTSRPEARKIFDYLPLNQARIDRLVAAAEAAGKLAPELVPHGPIPVTVKVRLAKNKRFSWHAPSVVKCSTPMKVPSTEVVVKEINKFLTIKSNGVEKVAEPAKKRSR